MSHLGELLHLLLNKDTFVSGAAVFLISEVSTSKDKWRRAALVVRGLLRRHFFVDSTTVTFCSVHLHNKVANKRDASTSLLQRLREHMNNHSVDFIGGDFNINAFSTVGDVFSDPKIAARGNSLWWGLGGLDETCRGCTGFIIMPRHPDTWRVQSHGCCKFDNADMGFGPRDLPAHFPAFLHLRVTNLLGPDSIMRSDQARQRRMEKAVGSYERERLHRRRGLQASSSTATSSNVPRKTSCARFSVVAHWIDAREDGLCPGATPHTL